MSFKIDKHVPLPENLGRKKRGFSKYPFKDMEIGDSFTVTGKSYGALNSCGKTWARNNDATRKFIVRNIDDVTVRVWRVK